MTIVGTGLPTTDIAVKFANTECATVTATETEVTCSLKVQPAAGSWNVRLIDYRGLIPINSTVAADTRLLSSDSTNSAVTTIDVALVIDAVSPATDLNQLGGDVITFTGSGFDTDLVLTNITFSDDSTCIVASATDTTLSCMVDGFNATTIDIVNPYSATIVVNNVTNVD